MPISTTEIISATFDLAIDALEPLASMTYWWSFWLLFPFLTLAFFGAIWLALDLATGGD